MEIQSGSYYHEPFAIWLRDLQRFREMFKKLLKRFDIPQTTAYNWSSGKSRPSGKYLPVYQYFLEQQQKNRNRKKKPSLEEDEDLVLADGVS